MREIKFRQALFSFGKFVGWHHWGFIKGKFVSPRSGPASALKQSQQFIGLRDKKRKKIYDGDIVAFGGGHGLIDYNRGGWRMGDDDFPTNYTYKELEVIGNIYENPELLEPEAAE